MKKGTDERTVIDRKEKREKRGPSEVDSTYGTSLAQG